MSLKKRLGVCIALVLTIPLICAGCGKKEAETTTDTTPRSGGSGPSRTMPSESAPPAVSTK